MTTTPAQFTLSTPEGWSATVQVLAYGTAWQYTAVISDLQPRCRISRFSPPELEAAVLAEMTTAAHAWIDDYIRRVDTASR